MILALWCWLLTVSLHMSEYTLWVVSRWCLFRAEVACLICTEGFWFTLTEICQFGMRKVHCAWYLIYTLIFQFYLVLRLEHSSLFSQVFMLFSRDVAFCFSLMWDMRPSWMFFIPWTLVFASVSLIGRNMSESASISIFTRWDSALTYLFEHIGFL